LSTFLLLDPRITFTQHHTPTFLY